MFEPKEVRQNAQRKARSAAQHFGRALARRKAVRSEQSERRIHPSSNLGID
ncbi:hypothetical protein OQJ13_16030 [Legionella sp. PATHC035]|uniref:hypothetical protein n=1 Tax=Legionella sp. PATHC035 TaxID=2992040 RepID=UPI002243D3F1|nr:hypothetical protein [Legionella sp. PATHC035]MCW8410487.1 hypothetical protein [Legionella sp. PATHC035]MCW8410488.1 hypothetical protein [Legionella sp. PATHC035]MCW8410489.1 hypothetical protein [Legionella sp. PATHC035]